MFLIGGLIFDLFLAFILMSYFKNGNQYDNPQPGLEEMQANQNNAPGEPQTNVPRGRFTSNQGGVRVGGPIDENALEGKDPKVVNKAFEELDMSLNGGIDQRNDPADRIHEDPVASHPNNSQSDDDTPDDDIYENPQNKVIDRTKDKKTKDADGSGPPAFPGGQFI
jgi:hypothetical protein